MNIKNRLKQLESQVIKADSNFCDCETELRTIVIVPSSGGGKMTLDGKPYIEPSDEEAPELCATCGKPNRDPFHCTFIINPNVELNGET